MKIAYITSGAAGMFCGSCMHDNTLVTVLRELGHDAFLIPTYTPVRTDEPDAPTTRMFFGGINLYLQQKSALFRHTPWTFDRLLDFKPLLRWVGKFAVKTQAEKLGALTLSMMQGEHGRQRKEIDKLVHWLVTEARPDIVNLSNVLVSALVPELKKRVQGPVIGTLQGDDIFLDFLPTQYREPVMQLAKEHCRAFDGFIATSNFYADYMATYLDIPRAKIEVVYPGLNLQGHGDRFPERNGTPPTIGYFARISPEKGFHHLVDAFLHLRKSAPGLPVKLRASGWLGGNNRTFFEEQCAKLQAAGLGNDFEHIESPDHASKVRFLQSIDVLSVPTSYREPKGLYILEALANGVPVVQPRHGSFPELIEATSGGLLVEPGNPGALAESLKQLLLDPALRQEMGRKGQEAIRQRFTARRMAEQTAAIYQRLLA